MLALAIYPDKNQQLFATDISGQGHLQPFISWYIFWLNPPTFYCRYIFQVCHHVSYQCRQNIVSVWSIRYALTSWNSQMFEKNIHVKLYWNMWNYAKKRTELQMRVFTQPASHNMQAWQPCHVVVSQCTNWIMRLLNYFNAITEYRYAGMNPNKF